LQQGQQLADVADEWRFLNEAFKGKDDITLAEVQESSRLLNPVMVNQRDEQPDLRISRSTASQQLLNLNGFEGVGLQVDNINPLRRVP